MSRRVQRPLLPRLGWLMCRRPGCHLLTVVGMTTTSEALTSPADDHDVVLRLATSAYLGRYTGTSRIHTASDLRLFFAWCADQHLAFGPPARTDQEVCAVHAGNPPIQTLHRVPAYGRGHRVLPDLRDRRSRGALAHRLRPPSPGASRVTIAAAITSRSSPRLCRAGFLDLERAASAAVESLEQVADVADDPTVRVPATDEDRPCTGVRRRASPARGAAYRQDSFGEGLEANECAATAASIRLRAQTGVAPNPSPAKRTPLLAPRIALPVIRKPPTGWVGVVHLHVADRA
jgi:hypothetical protein